MTDLRDGTLRACSYYLQMDSLNSSVRQLEMERNQIIDQLHLEQERRKEAQNKLNDLQTELANQSTCHKNIQDKHSKFSDFCGFILADDK